MERLPIRRTTPLFYTFLILISVIEHIQILFLTSSNHQFDTLLNILYRQMKGGVECGAVVQWEDWSEYYKKPTRETLYLTGKEGGLADWLTDWRLWGAKQLKTMKSLVCILLYYLNTNLNNTNGWLVRLSTSLSVRIIMRCWCCCLLVSGQSVCLIIREVFYSVISIRSKWQATGSRDKNFISSSQILTLWLSGQTKKVTNQFLI